MHQKVERYFSYEFKSLNTCKKIFIIYAIITKWYGKPNSLPYELLKKKRF